MKCVQTRRKLRTAALWILGASIVGLVSAAEKAPVARPASEVIPDRAATLATEIDVLLRSRWETAEVTPAPAADDAEFLRRVYLDLAGKIPRVAEVRRFLADDAPEKRSRLIHDLLNRPTYAKNVALVLRRMMLPELDSTAGRRFSSQQFDGWLMHELASDTGYDDIVYELLTLPAGGNPRMGGANGAADARAALFFQVKQYQPESLAAATSRAFLGVRLECAQCHDHPFADWEQDDFWSLAAFFGRIPQANQSPVVRVNTDSPDAMRLGALQIRVPDTDRVVNARYVGHAEDVRQSDRQPLQLLAEWIVTEENPYFARAMANRVWEHLLGTGLVDPVDDFDPSNPPSHPELLDALAAAFVESDYDLRFLVSAICRTKAYQLTSALTDEAQQDPHLFARAVPRALTPQQMHDSLLEVAGGNGAGNNLAPLAFSGEGAEFIELFGEAGISTKDRARTVIQALSLMNGATVARVTSPLHGRMVAAVAQFPTMTNAERVETLYLSTLTRMPTADELEIAVDYVDSGGPEGQTLFALSDVLWALVNSSEFGVNH